MRQRVGSGPSPLSGCKWSVELSWQRRLSLGPLQSVVDARCQELTCHALPCLQSDVEMSFWRRAGAWVATPWFQVQGPLGGSEYLYSARVHAQTKRMLPEGRKGKLVVGLMASRTKEGVFNLPKEVGPVGCIMYATAAP